MLFSTQAAAFDDYGTFTCDTYKTARGGGTYLDGREDKAGNNYYSYDVKRHDENTGSINFYAGSESQKRGVYFETKAIAANKYEDEANNPDKPNGYIERARNYAKTHNYSFPADNYFVKDCKAFKTN